MTLNNTQAVIPVPSKQSRKWMLLIYKFTSELAPLIIISMLALWYYLANTFNSNPYNESYQWLVVQSKSRLCYVSYWLILECQVFTILLRVLSFCIYEDKSRSRLSLSFPKMSSFTKYLGILCRHLVNSYCSKQVGIFVEAQRFHSVGLD